MIKVLHLTTDSKIAGAEKLLIEMARDFNGQKFELFFCTLKGKGDLHKELEKLNKKNFSLNCSGILDLPIAAIKLISLIKKYKIDIVHTHLFHASVFGQFIVRILGGPKGIMTRHYSDLLYLYGSKYQRFLDSVASRFANRIIAISEGVKSVLIGFESVDPKKITVIYNGTQFPCPQPKKADIGNIKKEFSLSQNVKVIGSVGTLHPRKGHRYLIESAKLLCKERDDIIFLIVGDGWLKDDLVRLRDRLDLKDKIIFAGYRKNTMDLLAIMDIVVHPSVEEGFGLSIIEAMSMSKPVIATRVGGIPEIIEDDKTGMLVPAKDPVLLAKAIKFLLDNPDTRESISLAASKSVEARFNLKDMISSYQRFYESVL